MSYKIKKYLTIFSFLFILPECTFAADDMNHNDFSASIGINAYFLSPNLELGYRYNGYFGGRVGIEYIALSDASKAPAAKSYMPKYAHNLLSNFEYSNLLVPLMLDVYPMENSFKASIGLGYINTKFTNKDTKKILTNKNKIAILANVGYEGLFQSDGRIGYNAEVGVNILDTVLTTTLIQNVPKSEWKVFPIIKFGVTYKF